MEQTHQQQPIGAASPEAGVQRHRPQPPTAIECVLGLLQGEARDVLADAGITGYDAQRLDRLSAAAKLESENCFDRIRCLLDLLNACLPQLQPHPNALFIGVCGHLATLVADFERWQALAENAAYYRDHPQVALQIAAARG